VAVTDDFLQRPCWIFDLDGTLTCPVHDFDYMRRELGMAPGADILGTIAALPEPQRFDMTLQLDALEMKYARLAKPAEGVLHLLVHLHNRGAKLGILTRNSREIALSSLAAIGASHFFEPAWVLGRDEARPKPDPEGIQRLLSHWGATPEQAVMVGDFRFDLEVGRAAGTATVHVAEPEQDGWPALTDLRVSTLTELLNLVY